MKQVESLFVAEFSAQSPITTLPEANLVPHDLHLFEIRTCQRTLFIGFNHYSHKHPFLKAASPRRFYENAAAYEFLLKFAAGLESEIKGETDVFGQTKTAVKNFLNNPNANSIFAEEIHTLFLKVFTDTKEIRSEFLRGIGGNTYGTLSRRILSPTTEDRVVVVGAGQISKSVAPYFAEFNLRLWNRSPERLFSLKTELEQKAPFFIQAITGEGALSEAIAQATMVILATPSGSEIDSLTQKFLRPGQKILHLGGQAADTMHFANHPVFGMHFWSLTDLFLLEKEQCAFREKQVRQAEAACHHRAVLRQLARSIYISHGWEDLALFN